MLVVELISAFKTINESELLEMLKDIIKPKNLRIIYTLLNGTEINVRFGSIATRLNTEIGSSQETELSPIFYGIRGSGSRRSSISAQKRNHI